jgi:predicted kinase
MRGITGSGKSTLAKELAGEFGVIHSTDKFFYHADGTYHFDFEELENNHNRNFEDFCLSLREGVPVVICDNTNSQKWEFARYVEAAEAAGYRVAIVILPHPDPQVAADRSTKKTPTNVIAKMIYNWEY